MTRYGIVGLGRVGSVIARALTVNGHDVLWYDPAIDTAPSDAGLRAPADEVRTCEVVVECVDENRATKLGVLTGLVGSPGAVLTTTSSFTVAELSEGSGLGGRLGGFHILPSYGGQLAEITSIEADVDVQHAASELATELGLGSIEVADRPGRISRRLLVPFLENVLRAVDLGIASPEDLDRVVELGLGHSVGPLRRLAEAGLEDHRAAAKVLLATLQTPALGPATHEEGSA